jgi:uncharacterized protein involved in exopolysaccharide biosynthesis
MQDFLNTNPNDEIDLKKLFITLWTYKFFIASTCALGIILGGYIALNMNKKFTSVAVFKLDQANSGNISIGDELGAIASLAGIKTNQPGTLPIDQIMGRVFIQNLDKKVDFLTDPYFNTYNPNSLDPVWKSLIKRIIGWKKTSKNPQEAIWQNILTTYSKNILLRATENNSIEIIVTHSKALRAAEIANIIMEEIIYDTRQKRNAEQDEQLSYLSETLAQALSDLETSQSKLKEFTMKNSALPLESFAAGSLQLELLREQLNRTTELHKAVSALSLILINERTDRSNYLSLRQKFPIVDQVEFRRVMGQNEIISSWSWPETSTVNAVLDTLSERINRLQSQINTSEIAAKRSGLALKTYAKLQREAKISEATYTVLIEQVKAQSMIAGYRPNKTEVYEYAAPSVNPSAPNRNLIIAFGAIIGLLLGALLALIIAHLRGVYCSKNYLIAEVQARYMINVKTLMLLRNKSLKDVNTILKRKPQAALRDMAVGINKSGAAQVIITSSRAKMSGNDVAQALASYMQSEKISIAIINFSSSTKNQNIDTERLSIGSFVVTESIGNVSILETGRDMVAMELLSQRNFLKDTKSLNSTFDLVFLCADNRNAISLLSALEGQPAFHIIVTRTKSTKSTTLAQMRSLLPIQGLLHD